jgi:SHS2 domain-containing protein
VSPYREVDHTADWALHVWAPTLEALFVEAARGMYALAGAQAKPGAVVRRRVELAAEDHEALLVAWLQELLYFTESEELAFTDYHVARLDATHLRAEVEGGPGERLEKAIKAVTYHNLSLRRTADGYETTLVFDV